MALPSIAWHDLVYGAERREKGGKRTYLFEYLRDVVHPSMPVLPYDAAAARWHGRARAQLEKEGHPTPFADGQIAAIAATEELTVVTQNASDFEKLFGGWMRSRDTVGDAAKWRSNDPL